MAVFCCLPRFPGAPLVREMLGLPSRPPIFWAGGISMAAGERGAHFRLDFSSRFVYNEKNGFWGRNRKWRPVM